MCIQAIKFIALLALVTLFTFMALWPYKTPTATEKRLCPIEELEKQVKDDESRIRPRFGQGGKAVILKGENKRLGEITLHNLSINVYASDLIPYDRILTDHRNPDCVSKFYNAELPSASVIIVFYNEPYSVLVRTIWSVLNDAKRDMPWYTNAHTVDRETGRHKKLGYPGQNESSPFIYLKDIILIDDHSDLPELHAKLKYYIHTRMPSDMIQIRRLPKRRGIPIALHEGVLHATGDVLVFLNARCEVMYDWLRPLLQRVHDKRTAVVQPIIDVISRSTFKYEVQGGNRDAFQVGGFMFNGDYMWVDVPEREQKRRGSNIAPALSPVMADVIFAMNKEYYWELGGFDLEMESGSRYNLEMSFRVWQCGGTIEIIPCSRVGHVYRPFHPYIGWRKPSAINAAAARIAVVWMDDYSELFYLHRPHLRTQIQHRYKLNAISVDERIGLRQLLGCKSFQWYLDNVYKEKFIPLRGSYAFGRFRNPSTGLCLDSRDRKPRVNSLSVFGCHDEKMLVSQFFILTRLGQIYASSWRSQEVYCPQLLHNRLNERSFYDRLLIMVNCTNRDMGRWRYTSNKQLKHVQSHLCLDSGFDSGTDVMAAKCVPGERTQVWEIDYSEHNDFKGQNNTLPLNKNQLDRLLNIRWRQ